MCWTRWKTQNSPAVHKMEHPRPASWWNEGQHLILSCVRAVEDVKPKCYMLQIKYLCFVELRGWIKKLQWVLNEWWVVQQKTKSKGENDTTSCGSVDSKRVKEEQPTDNSQLASQRRRQTVTHQCHPHDPSSLQCSKCRNKLVQLVFMCQHHDILCWEWLPAAYTAELIHCHCSLARQIWGENGVHCSNDSNIQLCLCSIIVWYISEWRLYGKWCSVLVNQSLRLEAGHTLIPSQRSVYHVLVVEP